MIGPSRLRPGRQCCAIVSARLSKKAHCVRKESTACSREMAEAMSCSFHEGMEHERLYSSWHVRRASCAVASVSTKGGCSTQVSTRIMRSR